jgi:hypothetical protein
MPNLSCLQQGWGMIQVDKALEHLQIHKDLVMEDVRFEVLLDGRAGNPRGIYIRQAEEASVRQSFVVWHTSQPQIPAPRRYKSPGLIGTLTSIMTYHTYTRDQQIEAHPDDTFYVIQDGTLLVNGGDMDNVTLGLGDYLGERA